ncbi:hypothetical protein J6A31_05655 [bacterium]|nr:hypothetical protein [bacterium]
MLPSERHKKRMADYMEKKRQRELSGESYVSNNKIIYSKGYSKETEDAIIDIANGRQPKINVMFDMLDFDEMLINVREYGRKGIYMMTPTRKAYYESIGAKLKDK